jgi:hypothetical protein
MRSILSSILGGLILGCTIQMNHNTISVDYRLRAYYDQFVAIANKCDVPVNESELRVEMSYDLRQKPYYAITYPFLNTVVVNVYKYRRLPKMYQEQVIFHELGHGLLSLHHDDTDLNIMNTFNFIPEQDFVVRYDYYIRKLFKDCKYKGVFVYGRN